MRYSVSEMNRTTFRAALAATAVGCSALVFGLRAQQAAPVGAPAKPHSAPIGYDDTPMLPGQPWRVHDIKRPHPPMVTPGDKPGGPPSDAVVLFDGKDLSRWVQQGRGNQKGQMVPAAWKVEDGYIEEVGGTGDLISKEKFGNCQIHLEWMAPPVVVGDSQDRGNSGVLLMHHYEIQVLDSWNNVTYADGQAGAIYGQHPPLVNVSRKPGEWQTYDIIFEAPRFEGEKLAKPAYATVIYNGVVVHHHEQIIGRMVHREVATYAPHAAEEPFALQDHGTKVRYRNIWIRRLKDYDQP
jgi:hypothetical protein